MSGQIIETRPSRAVRGQTGWIIPLGVAISYLLFAVAVHLRLLDGLDVAVSRAARPGDIWGPVQARASRGVFALRPSHLGWLLLLVVAATSLVRRSLRPAVATVAIGVPVAAVALGTKWVMAHSDSRTTPVAHGSFPSGHTVAIIFTFGVSVLLLRPGTRWGWLVPAGMGCVMGTALILASVHPATDVIGAGLLVAAALAAARAAGLGHWAVARRTGSR
jgi:hypothetical protein